MDFITIITFWSVKETIWKVEKQTTEKILIIIDYSKKLIPNICKELLQINRKKTRQPQKHEQVT